MPTDTQQPPQAQHLDQALTRRETEIETAQTGEGDQRAPFNSAF